MPLFSRVNERVNHGYEGIESRNDVGVPKTKRRD